MIDYPKILFITTCSFNKISGGGITFSNLFLGWPIKNLATIHCDENISTNDICNIYYKLSSKEISYFGLSKFGGSNSLPTTLDKESKINFLNKFKYLQNIKFFLFGNNFPNRGHLSPELIEFIDNFKPDVIYTVLGFTAIIDLVDKISCRYNLPVVTHIMDDWISSNYSNGLFSFIERSRVNRRFVDILSKSSSIILISESMKSVYVNRYNIEARVIQNAIDFQRFNNFGEIVDEKVKQHRIVYTGSIFPYAQLDSLILFCNTIKDLNNQGLNIEFHIYSPTSMARPLIDQFLDCDFIKFFNPIQDDNIYFSTLSNADILLLPSNFDSTSIKYIGLSMPTKVPSYLISGTPILVIGDIKSAQVEYAINFGWGLVVTTPNISIIGESIIELLNNINLRNKLIYSAKKVAKQFHDIEIVRSEFQNLFLSIS